VQGRHSVDGESRRRRPLIDHEASRRTFLRGVAAAGIGTAMAALWEPSHVARVRTGVASAAVARTTGDIGNAAGISSGAIPSQSGGDQTAWIAHLLRRTGFAATAADIATYAPLGIAGAVDALLGYDQVADPALDYANNAGLDLTKLGDLQRWWLLRMIYTTRPLQEKLTLFWHGLLTSGVSKVGGRYLNTLIAQNEFLRANATGSMDVLLKGISRDPAMMVWLDLQTSSKAHPNENFARELMELFSLGIGHYSEDDVRAGAKAFTGYQLDKDRHFIYNAKNHDDSQKTFLGQTGAFVGDQVIDIILQQQASSEYLVTRLWDFFAYPNPEPEVVAALADTFQSSRYSIKAVLRQLFTMPQFYNANAYQALIKSPAEFVVGAARGLALSTDGTSYPQQMALMSQSLFDPPNVAGWPGGAIWMSSASFFARMNFLNSLIYAKTPPDASALLGDYASLAATDAVALAASRLLSVPLSPSSAGTVAQFLADSNGGNAAVTNKNVKGLLYLVMAAPEGQLN